MTVVFTDDFVRADSATLAATGKPWTNITSTTGGYGIVSNQANATNVATGRFGYALDVALDPDQYAQATFITLTADSMSVRINADTTGVLDSGIGVALTPGGTIWEIFKKDPFGGYSSLGSGSTSFSAGTHILGIRKSGSTYTAYLDGVDLGSASDSSFSDGGAGLGGYSASTGSVILTGFECGNVSGSVDALMGQACL